MGSSSLDQFLNLVLDIPVLRAFLFDGVVSTKPEIVADVNLSAAALLKPMSLELSVPVVTPQQVAELRASLEHRVKHFGFAVANPIESSGEAAFPLAPDTQAMTTAYLNEAHLDDDEDACGPDLVAIQSLSQEILREIGTNLEVDDPLQENVARLESDYHSGYNPSSQPLQSTIPSSHALVQHTFPRKNEVETSINVCAPSMVFGEWVCAEAYVSNDTVCLAPFLSKLGIHDYERVSTRMVANSRRGSKLEFIELSSGHSVLCYGLMGVATPLVLESAAYLGKPSFLAGGGAALGRTRLINMSECCWCRVRGAQLCTCPKSDCARGDVAHSNLFYETCEQELENKFQQLVVERERLPHDLDDQKPQHMNGLSIALAMLSKRVPAQCKDPAVMNQYKAMGGLTWYRVQNFSMKGRLWMEEYKLITSSFHPIELAEADLFKILFANTGTKSKFFSSPNSDRLLLPSARSDSEAMDVEEDLFFGDHAGALWIAEEKLGAVMVESITSDISLSPTSSRRALPEDSVLEGADLSGLRCLKCEKDFTSKFNLKRHMGSVHSEARPFECEDCGLAFKVRDHLQQHVRVSHGVSRRHEFQCFQCEGCVTFLTRSNLLRHIRETHEKMIPHPCPECGKEFRSRFSLRRHTARHSNAEKIALNSGNESLSAAPVA